jgi:hypothetical protein
MAQFEMKIICENDNTLFITLIIHFCLRNQAQLTKKKEKRSYLQTIFSVEISEHFLPEYVLDYPSSLVLLCPLLYCDQLQFSVCFVQHF